MLFLAQLTVLPYAAREGGGRGVMWLSKSDLKRRCQTKNAYGDNASAVKNESWMHTTGGGEHDENTLLNNTPGSTCPHARLAGSTCGSNTTAWS